MKRNDVVSVAVVVVVWIAVVAAIDPRGNFPLHDDWIYAVSTWAFAHTGHFFFPSVAVVSLRSQVLWGALWTWLFGESFTVLRASTLMLSLATLLILQRLIVRAGAPRWVSVLGALALLFNPAYLWSSCTFMTDVPYVFASVVAFYFFLRGIDEERVLFVVVGTAAVIVSWFIRQNGVVNLFPPLVLLALGRPRRWRALVAPIVAGGLLFGCLLLFKREWLSGSPQMFVVHYHMWLESTFRLEQQVSVLSHYIGFNAINCALFFLPLTLPLILLLRNRKRAALALLGAIVLAIGGRTAWLAWNGYLVPYSAQNFSDILPGPLFVDFGVGPPNLIDTWNGAPYPFTLPHAARLLLTVAAAMLASLLVWALALARGGHALKLAMLSVAFGTLMLFASGLYFDRYSLDSAWAIAIALPLVIPWQQRSARSLAAAALLILAIFSTPGVQEHFRWQRARWTAWNDLRARGVAVEQIEGGAEANGFYELAHASLSQARRGHPPRPYAITFRPLDGYRVVDRYPFTSFLGMRRGEICVLERTAGTTRP